MKPVVAFAVALLLAGCATFTEPQYRAAIQQQDAASCAANPHPLPGCVFGLMFFGKWKF